MKISFYDEKNFNKKIFLGKMSVVVLIINNYTKESDPNVHNIKALFSDPFFIVEICRLTGDSFSDPGTGTGVTVKGDTGTDVTVKGATTGTNAVNADDTKIYCKALKYAQEKYPQLPCLLIKDNNVCYLNATEMKNKIQDACVIMNDNASTATQVKDALIVSNNALSEGNDTKAPANLIYLNVYGDQCSKYSAVSSLNGEHQHLVWTKMPNSTQALLFSPEARNLLLSTCIDNKNEKETTESGTKNSEKKEVHQYSNNTMNFTLNDLIKKEKIHAMAFSPNLVEFDIKFALDNKDYNKLAQCANMESSTMDSTSFITLVWVIIIIIFLMILIFLTMQNIRDPQG